MIEALDICKEAQAASGKKMPAFKAALEGNPRVAKLSQAVQEFIKPFPMPGVPME